MAKSTPRRWQLQDAKNRFSEVVSEAERTGPQIVTRRGTEAAVVLSYDDYRALTKSRRGRTLVDVLLAAPKVPGGLRVDRRDDLDRGVDVE
ncbi:MAG: type II toxin-antitoxin system Phd/YefM family antitoxin [Deltaproteobacteria bacterium]|nr:type II toxin-antitoxin system Phd/YefM family antitoxin [Deltaproteobacteria bacterium]